MAEETGDKVADLEKMKLALEEEVKAREKVLQSMKDQKASADTLRAAAIELRAKEEELTQTIYDQQIAMGVYNKEAEEELQNKQRQLQALKRESDARDRITQRIDSFAAKAQGSIGILDDFAASGMSVADVAAKMKDAFTGADGKLDKLAVGAAITAPVFEAVKDALIMNAKAVADMTSEVASATGEGMKYNSMIANVGTANREFGVGMVEAGKATMALKDNMSLFNMVGDDMSEQMVGVAARMETLGISAADSGAQMEFTMRVMGGTAEQAAQGVNDLAAFAGGIGVAPAKMAKEFQAAAPALASYGKNATKVFKGLATQSKKLGLSMNELLGITQQFDTFDGAFDAAGKLNSLLGGNFLDSMELMTAETEEQRVQLLQNALTMSGQSFDAMSRHEKMAVANSIGISDMSVATKLLSESNRELGKDVNESSISQEELAERQKAGVSFTKKMEMAMQGFAIALMPVANLIQGVASVLVTLANNPFSQFVIGAVAAIYMLIKAIQIAKAITTAYTAVKAMLTAAEGTGIVSKTLSAAKNYILSGSQAAVAATAAPAAAGMAATGAAGGAAAGPLAALGVALLKLAVAVFLIGVGVGVLAAGMSLLVNAFIALLQLIIDNIAIMPQVIISLYLLAIGFQLLGISLLVAGVGMLVFTYSLLAMVLIGVPAIMAMIVPMFLFGLAIVGVAVAMLGLAISVTAIALGLGLMIKNLSGVSGIASPTASTFLILAAAFAAMAISIALLAYTMVPSVAAMLVPMLLFGMAVAGVSISMIALGIAVTVIAFGLGLMVKNFANLGQMLPNIAANFGLLAITFASMAASIVLLGYVMGTFGGAIAVLAIPLMLIGMTIIGIALAIKSMATAISEMGVDNAMVTFMTTVNSVDDAKVENLEEMMDQAQRYVFIQAQMNAMEIANSIADGIGNLFGVGGDSGSEGGQNQKEIVLKLNEREFARAVVESLDSETKISLA